MAMPESALSAQSVAGTKSSADCADSSQMMGSCTNHDHRRISHGRNHNHLTTCRDSRWACCEAVPRLTMSDSIVWVFASKGVQETCLWPRDWPPCPLSPTRVADPSPIRAVLRDGRRGDIDTSFLTGFPGFRAVTEE